MTQSNSILIGEGLPNIKFGMTKSQIKKILGVPDESEVYAFSEQETDVTEAWHYDDLGLSLSFDQENDWLLGSIAVSDDQYQLDGLIVIGLDQESLLDKLKSLSIEEITIESHIDTDDGTEVILINCEEDNISFWLEDDIVSEVKWSPRWIDTDLLEWPSESDN
ncbi:MAG: hypothetical protein KJP00_12425 [Bacteroidia bacterium]|nr:hypothetical protein [Bacteroidia bacterium]